MMLLAHSDGAAGQHARLLRRRPNLRAASVLRWFAWEGCDETELPWPRLYLQHADGWDRAANAVIDSLPVGLRSLVVGQFALTPSTLTRLDRRAASPGPRGLLRTCARSHGVC